MSLSRYRIWKNLETGGAIVALVGVLGVIRGLFGWQALGLPAWPARVACRARRRHLFYWRCRCCRCFRCVGVQLMSDTDLRFTIHVKGAAGETAATITETDIANSIKRLGRDAKTGLRQIEFVINRVLEQRASDTDKDRTA